MPNCQASTSTCVLVGVFTGYSSLAWALSMPEDGKVVACDISTEYTDIGKPFWEEAGVDHKIDLRIAPAVETLRESLVLNSVLLFLWPSSRWFW